MKKFALTIGTAVLALAAASPAMAARTFTLTATGSEFNINATLITTDDSNNVGYNGNTGYLINSISGSVINNSNGNSQTINGLVAVGGYPIGNVPNDNILKTTAPFFDLAGVSFTTAQGGSPFNLYYSGGYFFIRGAQGGNSGSFTSVTVRPAVPEPATWAMMMLGFGAMGYAMRRKSAGARVRFA